MARKKMAPTFDLWSIAHVAWGVGLAIIGIPVIYIFFIGIGWEIVEHTLLKPLADVGGEEGWDNIASDIVLMFLGGAAWFFLFG